MGCRIRFVDVDPLTMCIDLDDLKRKMTPEVEAVVVVDYAGAVPDYDDIRDIVGDGVPIIEDAAQSIGGKLNGVPVGAIADYTAFSFQAIKTLTTIDGGMLTMDDDKRVERARRLRWFGIDRDAKLTGNWNNEIDEAGFKYQMTDVSAELGLRALDCFASTMNYRRSLLQLYSQRLKGVAGIRLIADAFIGTDRHAAWTCTVEVDDRELFEKMLHDRGVESGQVHYRNDRYRCFDGSRADAAMRDTFPNMDAIERRYQVLPLHMALHLDEVEYICECIRQGW